MQSRQGAGAKRKAMASTAKSVSIAYLDDRLKYTRKKHADEMMCGLNKLRLEGQFCDFVIKIDNEDIPCHKAVLVLTGDYFSAMLGAGMTESTQGEIQLVGMDADAMKIIIDYLYTGKLDVTQDKVQELLMISDRLGLEQLKQVCAGYVETKIDFSNCLDFYQFGQQYGCSHVVEKCEKLIKQQFVKLLEEGKLSVLPAKILTEIISWKDLYLEPAGEQYVLDAVCEWTIDSSSPERLEHFPALLDHVRLSQLPPSSLARLRGLPLLQEHPDLQEALDARVMRTDDGKRMSMETLYVVGGYLQSRTGPHCPRLKSAIMLESSSLSLWERIADLPLAGSGILTLAPHRRLISFLYNWRASEVDGHSIEEHRTLLEYNPLKNEWFDISAAFCKESMDLTYQCLTCAGSTAFCARTNRLYLMTKHAVHMFTVEQEDGDLLVSAKTHRMLPTPPQLQAIKFGDFGLVVCQDNLWCIGGHNMKAKFEVDAMDSLWRMDIEDGTWTQMQNLGEKRAKMAVVEKDGLIFVFGGYNGYRLATGEVYDPRSNTWDPIASMEKHRTHFSACVFKGKIYIMGGKSYNFNNTTSGFGPRKVLKFTEIYDPDTDKWSMGPIMPDARCMYGAAVL